LGKQFKISGGFKLVSPMLLFYDIKRDINPLSAHFVPLFGLVALRRKQNTSETSVFSDLRIVNGNEESLVWE